MLAKNNTNKCNDNRAEHEATFLCKTYEMKDGSKNKNGIMDLEHIICDAKIWITNKKQK